MVMLCSVCNQNSHTPTRLLFALHALSPVLLGRSQKAAAKTSVQLWPWFAKRSQKCWGLFESMGYCEALAGNRNLWHAAVLLLIKRTFIAMQPVVVMLGWTWNSLIKTQSDLCLHPFSTQVSFWDFTPVEVFGTSPRVNFGSLWDFTPGEEIGSPISTPSTVWQAPSATNLKSPGPIKLPIKSPLSLLPTLPPLIPLVVPPSPSLLV
jgi:hypothetical protein